MAIVSLAAVQDYTGDSYTGANATSIERFCMAVDTAVKRMIFPFRPEPVTITNQLIDAPMTNILEIPLTPVRSITSLYLHWGSNGDASAFDLTNDILVNHDDYYMPIDDPINSWSRTGFVYRRGASTWGYEMIRRLGRLYVEEDPNRGAILANYTAGAATVPADIESAAVMAVVLMYQHRKTGAPLNSENWGGYSYSTASQFTAEGAIRTPEVQALLAPYINIPIA